VELLILRGTAGSGAVLMLALVGGCRAETPSPPSTLIDGSLARPPPVVLEGVQDPSVATVVRAMRPDDAAPGSTAASCIAAAGEAGEGAVVERVGVNGRSITFLGPGGRAAHGCDASTGDRPNAWCGHAFAKLESGRLRDPRLTLTCRAVHDGPVGFVWIQPSARTTYVVVRQSDYAEVYAVAGDVPVRVTTADADLMTSRAAFSISEHAEDGRRLRSYELEAQVAG